MFIINKIEVYEITNNNKYFQTREKSNLSINNATSGATVESYIRAIANFTVRTTNID